MTDEHKTEEERLREAAESLGFPIPDQQEMDRLRVYHMEQEELANELYESAVADGVNFATSDDSGDVFVNVKWLGMVVRTIAEAGMITGDLPEQVMRTAEVLGQTILAAEKFVGSNS